MKIELEAKLNERRVLGISELKKAADSGDIEACFLLGKCLLAGLNCSPDNRMAVLYLDRAAKKGNTSAMIDLALCYAEGRGMEKDFYMAELWIRAAEECGSKDTNVPARQIYLSTIGHHAPSGIEYRDYLFESLYRDKSFENEEELKRGFFAQAIIGETGKKIRPEEALKITLTENDIKSYEVRNDVCYGDELVKEKVNYSNSEKEALLRNIVQAVSEYWRSDIAKKIEILYHLCGDKDYKQQIYSMGIESSSKFKCDRPLTWFTRAQYGIVKPFFDSFDKKVLVSVIDSLRTRLNLLEEEELAGDLKGCNNNLKALSDLRVNIGRSKLYSKDIAQKYIKQVTQKIFDLQSFAIETKFKQKENDIKALQNLRAELRNKRSDYEAEVFSVWEKRITEKLLVDVENRLSKEFENVKENYLELCKMLKDLKHAEYEKEVLIKWEPLLAKQISLVQKKKLEELCANLSSKSHEELKSLIDVVKSKYSFDEYVSKDYIAKIEDVIDKVEINQLDKITSSMSSLTNSQYSELITTINRLNFKAKNTQQYLHNIEQGKRFTSIYEVCTDDMLEEYTLGKLQADLLAIEGLTFHHDKHSELVNKLNKHITLFKECKDKKTLLLLEKCEVENISKQPMTVLEQLIKAVDNHDFLPKNVKVDIIRRIDTQVSILNIEECYDKAKDNFDNLSKIFKVVQAEELPQEYKAHKTNQIRERIEELMVDASKKTTADLMDMDLRQLRQVSIFINRCIGVAKNCEINTKFFDELLVDVSIQFDVAENYELQKICEGLSNATKEGVVAIRDRIVKGGFTKENQTKYLALVDKRSEDLHFEEVQKKCTASALFKVFAKDSAIESLIKELESLGRKEEEIAPYINRVTNFLEIQNSFIEAVADLELRYAVVYREMFRSEMRSWGQYPICIIEPNSINEVQVSYKNILDRHEHIVFALNGVSDNDGFAKGLVVTNFGFHYVCKDKYIPLDELKSISSGMFFKSVTVKGEDDEMTIDVPWDSSVRKAFANDFWKVVAKINKHKNNAEKEYEILKGKYLVLLEDCLEKYSILNDNFTRTTQRGTDSMEQQDEANRNGSFSITGGEMLAKLSYEELSCFIRNLFTKHNLTNIINYYIPGDNKFDNKLRKAMAAYAYVESDEKCMVLLDDTIFGSATDGFVFTNKNIYFNNSEYKKQCVAIEDIDDVYEDVSHSIKRIYLSTDKGDYWFASGDKEHSRHLEMLIELINYVISEEEYEEEEKETIPVAQINSQSSDKWQCKCGNINTGNFCGNCGTSKKDAVPTTWTCSCGSVNKGNFCGNCGSRRKDD